MCLKPLSILSIIVLLAGCSGGYYIPPDDKVYDNAKLSQFDSTVEVEFSHVGLAKGFYSICDPSSKSWQYLHKKALMPEGDTSSQYTIAELNHPLPAQQPVIVSFSGSMTAGYTTKKCNSAFILTLEQNKDYKITTYLDEKKSQCRYKLMEKDQHNKFVRSPIELVKNYISCPLIEQNDDLYFTNKKAKKCMSVRDKLRIGRPSIQLDIEEYYAMCNDIMASDTLKEASLKAARYLKQHKNNS